VEYNAIVGKSVGKYSMFSELATKVSDNGRRRVLLKDFTYENDKYRITVKAGFSTDGASIPRVMWSVISSPFYGPIIYGAIVHDGLYTAMKLSRKESDELLKEMTLESGYSKVKAELVYNAVRAFGGSHWSKDTTDKKDLVIIEEKK